MLHFLYKITALYSQYSPKVTVYSTSSNMEFRVKQLRTEITVMKFIKNQQH
jgi:hypothetical protein